MELAVRCKDITKRFGEGNEAVMALRGINVDVYTGELMMLVGPSGCGKTTLISVIAGILNQTSGECQVLGKPINQLSSLEKVNFRAKNIGFVFQSFNLLPTLTAAENVAVPLIINRVPRLQAIAEAERVLEKVELKSRFNALPSQLSGGQQQRVAIARALVHNPRIIVCDEPTSSLDHETGARVMDLMRSVVLSEKRTLIIVTHDNRIFHYADRIAKMDDGMIETILSPVELAA